MSESKKRLWIAQVKFEGNDNVQPFRIDVYTRSSGFDEAIDLAKKAIKSAVVSDSEVGQYTDDYSNKYWDEVDLKKMKQKRNEST